MSPRWLPTLTKGSCPLVRGEGATFSRRRPDMSQRSRGGMAKLCYVYLFFTHLKMVKNRGKNVLFQVCGNQYDNMIFPQTVNSQFCFGHVFFWWSLIRNQRLDMSEDPGSITNSRSDVGKTTTVPVRLLSVRILEGETWLNDGSWQTFIYNPRRVSVKIYKLCRNYRWN